MKKLLMIYAVAIVMVLVAAEPIVPATLRVRPSGGVGTLQDVYTSIQQAIDDANSGYIISVAAGVYDGNTVGPEGHLVVDMASLTLRSMTGKDNTTIKVANVVGIDIRAGADNFVLGGSAGHGFTIAGKSDTTFVIQLKNAPSGVEISHNAIDTTGNASMGVSIGAAGAADLIISDNDFTANSGDGCIWGPRLDNITVSDNTFNGGSYAVQASGVTSNSPSVISGNVITNFTGSGGVVISNGEETSGLTISGNNITECSNGIRFAEYCAQGTAGNMTTVTLEDNTLSSNGNGILVGNGEHILASNFTIRNNCIIGNGAFGLKNEHGTELVTAEENAWGDAEGPYHPVTNPDSLGDEVSDNVDYYPWYPDCNFITPVYKPVHNITLGAYYDTIQEAVDAANPNDTIEVAAGTYNEEVIIAKAGITLKGNNAGICGTGTRGDESIIKAPNVEEGDSVWPHVACAIDIWGDANGVTVDGFTLEAGDDIVNVRTDDVNIINNIITPISDETPVDTQAPGIFACECTNLTISCNLLLDIGMRDPNTGGCAIFLGLWPGGGAYPVSNSLIEDNLIDNSNGTGILCYDTTGGGINIQNNTIRDVGTLDLYHDDGIRAGASGYGLTIQGNDIYGCSNNAVQIKKNGASHTINCNKIHENEYGVKNTDAATVDATFNWWGDVNGPSGEGGGAGDAVSENVDFFPWLLTDNIEECTELTETAADFVVDDDWADYPDWTTVTIGSTDYYIGLNAFDAIQEAVDAAADGNTIKVLDGTYDEEVTIDKDNLTLRSLSMPVIRPSTTPTNHGAAIYISADGVTVDGFEIDGTTVCDNGIYGWETSGLTIKNNVIHGAVNAWDGCGILLISWGNTPTVYDNLIQNNEVYDTGRMGIMVMEYGSTWTLTSDITITGNTVYDTWQVGWGDHGGSIQINVAKDCSITNNLVYDSNDRGIYMFGSASGNKIFGNTITNNPIGIQIWISGEGGSSIDWQSETPTSPMVISNDIYDNDTGAISTNIAGPNMVMDAEYNWWGDISGPNDPCGIEETTGVVCYDTSVIKNEDGLGDAVTENIDYCPWLCAPICRSDAPCPAGDLDFDCDVDFFDFAVFADNWLHGVE